MKVNDSQIYNTIAQIEENNDPNEVNYLLESLVGLPEYKENANAWIKEISLALENGSTSSTIRKLVEIHAAYLWENGESVYTKDCVVLCCAPLNAMWWFSRASVRSICLLFCIPVSCAEESKYLYRGRVKQTTERALEDWGTFFETLAATVALAVTCFNPKSAGVATHRLMQHEYIKVIRRKNEDEMFKKHVEAYAYWYEKARTAYKAGEAPTSKKDAFQEYFDQQNSTKLPQVENQRLLVPSDEEIILE